MLRSIEEAGIEVIDAPSIPGLRFRTFMGDADLTELAAVFNASYRADEFDLVVTPDSLRVEFDHLPNADASRDVLVAEVDGSIVGVSRRFWALRDGMRSYEHEGSVHPDYRGRGIGRAMLRTN